MKALLRFLFVLTSLSLLQAQDATPRKDVEPAHRPQTKVFKVSYSIYELEDGKKVNERSYMLPVRTAGDNAPRSSTLRVGTRVPITTKETTQGSEFTYLDVGMDIECDVTEQSDKFIVFTGLEINYIVTGPNAEPRALSTPVLRLIKERSTTLVSPGKPTLVTSIDDINSKKRVQVEVTVTRIE